MAVDTTKQLSLFTFSFSAGIIPDRNTCRTLVEQTLQYYLSTDKRMQLVFDDYGKPQVKDYQLTFSYSHSQTMLAIAVYPRAQAIGIDTEPLSRLNDILALRELAFSPIESDNLASEEYVTAWCRKESAVKQLGKGFREADPSDFIIKTDNKSYTLYIGSNEIQTGYFFNIVLGNDVIVICADEPIKDFLLYCRDLKKFSDKGVVWPKNQSNQLIF